MDYEAEVESDFRVFHHEKHPKRMTAPKYWRLAARLGAYQGAVAAALERDRPKEEDEGPRRPQRTERRDNPEDEFLNPQTVEMSPTTAGLFET